jgi:hypothetical protein
MENSSTSRKHLYRARSKGSLIHICTCSLMISPLKGGGGFLLKDRIILGMLDFSKKSTFTKNLQCLISANFYPICFHHAYGENIFPAYKFLGQLHLKNLQLSLRSRINRKLSQIGTQACKQIGLKQQTKSGVGFLCVSAAMIGFCQVFSLRIKNMREKVTPEVYGGPPVQVYPGGVGGRHRQGVLLACRSGAMIICKKRSFYFLHIRIYGVSTVRKLPGRNS